MCHEQNLPVRQVCLLLLYMRGARSPFSAADPTDNLTGQLLHPDTQTF